MAAMTMDDALHGSQTDSSAFKFFGSMKTLEDTKQFIHVFHVKADTVVFHK